MVGQVAAQAGQRTAGIAPPIATPSLGRNRSSLQKVLVFQLCQGSRIDGSPRRNGEQPGLGVADQSLRPTEDGIRGPRITSQEISNPPAMNDHSPSTARAAPAGIVEFERGT